MDRSTRVVRREHAPRRSLPVSKALGPVVKGSAPCHWDTFDPKTVEDGAIHRQACKKKTVDRKTLRAFRSFVNKYITKNYRRVKRTELLEFEEFLTRTSYTEKEKVDFRQAKVTSDRYSPFSLPSKYFRSKCFPKDEMTDEFKQARGICGRHAVIRVRYGPLIMKVEEVVYAADKHFVKHLTPKQRVAVMEERLARTGRKIENDYSTFEAGFSPELIDACEVRLVRWVLGEAVDSMLLDEMIWDMRGIVNTMAYKWFTVMTNGTRKSGDSHTSLANGFTNLMIFCYVCHKVGVNSFDIIVEGDDSIAWLDDWIPFKKTALDLGFSVKMGTVHWTHEGSFCQLSYEPESKTIIRHPGKIINKLPWSKTDQIPFNKKHSLDIYIAKIYSLASECNKCPVLWALAEGAFRRHGAHVVDWNFVYRHLPTYEREHLVSHWTKCEPPDKATRAFFAAKYLIPESYQLRLEEYFLTHTEGDYSHTLIYPLLRHEWFRMWDLYVTSSS